jgi:hypothetical protein
MVKNSQTTKQAGFVKRNQLALSLSFGFVIMVVMSLPSVMLIVFALLPTFVAFIVDRTPEKNAVFCVGSLNLCGVLPYLLDLWTGDNSMDAAILILTDVFSLVVIYGASAFGWMIFQSLPPVIATFITVLAQSRVSSLRSAQRKLIEEWGEIVATSQDSIEMLDRDDDVSASEVDAQPALAPSGSEKILDGVEDVLSDNEAG